jgi:hypothetical protein
MVSFGPLLLSMPTESSAHVQIIRAVRPESGFPGAHDCGAAVGGAELHEDVGHVVSDGLLAQDEASGDCLVGDAAGDEVEDLVLALVRGMGLPAVGRW